MIRIKKDNSTESRKHIVNTKNLRLDLYQGMQHTLPLHKNRKLGNDYSDSASKEAPFVSQNNVAR